MRQCRLQDIMWDGIGSRALLNITIRVLVSPKYIDSYSMVQK